jgi:hypothetical protein
LHAGTLLKPSFASFAIPEVVALFARRLSPILTSACIAFAQAGSAAIFRRRRGPGAAAGAAMARMHRSQKKRRVALAT